MKDREHIEIKLDDPAGIKPQSTDSIQNARIAELERRLAAMEEHPRNPVTEIVGDDLVYVERNGRKVAIGLDREELQNQLGAGGGGGGASDGGPLLFARIDSNAPIGINDANGNPVAWVYLGTQVFKRLDGSGNLAWDPLPGGYVGIMRNLCENGNTGVGIQDNGVNHDGADYPAGFAMVPIRGVVRIVFVITPAGTRECWFDRVNSEDGLCSGSGS